MTGAFLLLLLTTPVVKVGTCPVGLEHPVKLLRHQVSAFMTGTALHCA
jgi:hypothetical protein